MKITVAAALCGLLLSQLLPLSVQALDFDDRQIRSKYNQVALPDTQEENPWVENVNDPVAPIVVNSESLSAARASDSVDETSAVNDFWTSFRLWIGFLSTPYKANRTEARAL